MDTERSSDSTQHSLIAAPSIPRRIHQQPLTTNQCGGHRNCLANWARSPFVVSSTASNWKPRLYFGFAKPQRTDLSHLEMCAKTSSSGCILKTVKFFLYLALEVQFLTLL